MLLYCIVYLHTGIDELVDVKNFLKRVNDWQSLGLQLGLLYPTLNKIEIDYRGKVEQCKTEMIAAWLNQQDNVLKVGVPSWSVLKAALRKIGKNEVVVLKPTLPDVPHQPSFLLSFLFFTLILAFLLYYILH